MATIPEKHRRSQCLPVMIASPTSMGFNSRSSGRPMWPGCWRSKGHQINKVTNSVPDLLALPGCQSDRCQSQCRNPPARANWGLRFAAVHQRAPLRSKVALGELRWLSGVAARLNPHGARHAPFWAASRQSASASPGRGGESRGDLGCCSRASKPVMLLPAEVEWCCRAQLTQASACSAMARYRFASLCPAGHNGAWAFASLAGVLQEMADFHAGGQK